MRKLVICFILSLLIFSNVYSMELKFNQKDLDIKTFLTSCLKQVADKANQDKKSNEIKLRFLDQSTGKDFSIKYGYTSNSTNTSSGKHSAVGSVCKILLLLFFIIDANE